MTRVSAKNPYGSHRSVASRQEAKGSQAIEGAAVSGRYGTKRRGSLLATRPDAMKLISTVVVRPTTSRPINVPLWRLTAMPRKVRSVALSLTYRVAKRTPHGTLRQRYQY